MLKTTLAPLLLVFGLAACGDDDGAPASVDADPNAPDADPSAPDADPSAPDAAPPADAGPPCEASGNQFVRAVGGTGTTSKLIIIDVGNLDGTDGVMGVFREGTTDVRIEDSELQWAIGGSKFYAIDRNAIANGNIPVTSLGTTPALTALAQQGPDALFAAAGLAIYRITPDPFAITQVGTLESPGCTAVRDFTAALSDTTFVFTALMECGGNARVQRAFYTPGLPEPFSSEKSASTTGATADLRGVTLGFGVGDNLYAWQGTTFTLRRALSQCIDVAPGGIRGAW